MDVFAFIGPAGSGKTYALCDKLCELLSGVNFQEYQSVLAITFMKGSRKRLSSRLGNQIDGVRIHCETIDSFSLRLVNRFRRRINVAKMISASVETGEWKEDTRQCKASFEEIRKATISLLRNNEVAKCVSATHPIILIDEFQDCRSELLTIVQLLAKSSRMLVAGDDFQDLNSDGPSPAIEWLRTSSSQLTELSGSKRTTNSQILSSALALRNATVAELSIKVVPCPGAGLAAWQIASSVAWGKAKGTKALISPSRPGSSNWIDEIVSPKSCELGKKKKYKTVKFSWEESKTNTIDALMEPVIQLATQGNAIPTERLIELMEENDVPIQIAAKKLSRLARIRGENAVSLDEFQHSLEMALHGLETFGCHSLRSNIATTVHGAKNREFDSVFILWPHKIVSNVIQRRKLLYNAITRAKLQAILLVQGDASRILKDEVLQLLRIGIEPTLK